MRRTEAGLVRLLIYGEYTTHTDFKKAVNRSQAATPAVKKSLESSELHPLLVGGGYGRARRASETKVNMAATPRVPTAELN